MKIIKVLLTLILLLTISSCTNQNETEELHPIYTVDLGGKESFEKPTFGSEFTTIIETPANPVVYLVAVGVPSVVVAVGIVLVVHMTNKKRKMKENSDQ